MSELDESCVSVGGFAVDSGIHKVRLDQETMDKIKLDLESTSNPLVNNYIYNGVFEEGAIVNYPSHCLWKWAVKWCYNFDICQII